MGDVFMYQKQEAIIISSTAFFVFVLYLADQALLLNYNYKIVIKFLLLVLFPIIYIYWTRDNFMENTFDKLFKNNKLLTVFFSISCFLTIFISYIVLNNLLYLNSMSLDLKEKFKIYEHNIIYYGVYIVFINSLIEEFFFRGFIFLNLKKKGRIKLAYIISASAFTLYHISAFVAWFNFNLFLLMIAGLFIGGLIFNYIDSKSNSILNSWIVHIFADLAIISIALIIYTTM